MSCRGAGVGCTIVFKVQYVAGGDDKVTVWLNPNLSGAASEAGQPESLTTRFRANASFDQIRLIHQGKGEGWTFGDMAIATSFSDLAPHSLALTFRAWQREQGLPQNTVRALAQTRDGYLWVGTDDGLARFDGVRFVSFGPREGLRSGPVGALFEDRAGALWIGTTGGGLTRRQNGKFAAVKLREGGPTGAITALGEDEAGRIWIGTEQGLTWWTPPGVAAPERTRLPGRR